MESSAFKTPLLSGAHPDQRMPPLMYARLTDVSHPHLKPPYYCTRVPPSLRPMLVFLSNGVTRTYNPRNTHTAQVGGGLWVTRNV
jgi:hypothetical protein